MCAISRALLVIPCNEKYPKLGMVTIFIFRNDHSSYYISAMYYPLNLNGVYIYPLFGDFLKGKPYIFDFSSKNSKILEYNPADFKQFNAMVFDEMSRSS